MTTKESEFKRDSERFDEADDSWWRLALADLHWNSSHKEIKAQRSVKYFFFTKKWFLFYFVFKSVVTFHVASKTHSCQTDRPWWEMQAEGDWVKLDFLLVLIPLETHVGALLTLKMLDGIRHRTDMTLSSENQSRASSSFNIWARTKPAFKFPVSLIKLHLQQAARTRCQVQTWFQLSPAKHWIETLNHNYFFKLLQCSVLRAYGIQETIKGLKTLQNNMKTLWTQQNARRQANT